MPDDAPVPFSAHLNELRKRLIWIILGVFVAFSLVFSLWAKDIVLYIQGVAVVERERRAAPETLNEFPAAAVQVIGAAKPANGTFTADVALNVFTDPLAAYAPLPAPGLKPPTVLTGRLKPETTAALDDDGRVAFTLEFYDAASDAMKSVAVTVAPDAAMKLHGKGVANLAPAAGVIERLPVQFSAINPLETFSSTMRVSLYAALAFAYPWAMLHIYLFVAPGLYKRERRFFQVAIPSVFLLFFAGAAFGRYILLPISIGFLLDFNVEAFNLRSDYSLGQFLNLVFTLTFGLGFIFQLPLIVAPLVRFGLLSPDFFKRHRKWTLMLAVVLGALISPTGLIFDMFIAGAPVFFLIEGGVLIGRWWRKRVLKAAEREALRLAEKGEKIDPEELAGGLAFDLEKKLKEFSQGGARKFAQELMRGLREGRREAASDTAEKSLFDDNYTDDEKPPAEVKLKPRKPADPKPEPAPATKPDQAFTPATPAREKMDVEATPGGNGHTKEEWPDRPWVEGVDEKLAQYIEDRVSQRLQQYMERELRPWMNRVEDELRGRRED